MRRSGLVASQQPGSQVQAEVSLAGGWSHMHALVRVLRILVLHSGPCMRLCTASEVWLTVEPQALALPQI